MFRNSFCRLYVHVVFGTKHRFRFSDSTHRRELLTYMQGVAQAEKCHIYSGYVMPDHVHLLVGLHPAVSLSTLIQKIKANSSRHINENRWVPFKFSWSDGYGAFSCSESVVASVTRYIEGQEEHHGHNLTFIEEYRNLLLKQGVKEEELPSFHMTEEDSTVQAD